MNRKHIFLTHIFLTLVAFMPLVAQGPTPEAPEFLKDESFNEAIFKEWGETPWPFMSHVKKSNEISFNLNKSQKNNWDKIILECEKIIKEVQRVNKVETEKIAAERKKMFRDMMKLSEKKLKAMEDFAKEKKAQLKKEREDFSQKIRAIHKKVDDLISGVAKTKMGEANLIEKIVDIKLNELAPAVKKQTEYYKAIGEVRQKFDETPENRKFVREEVKLEIQILRLVAPRKAALKPFKKQYLDQMQKLYEIYKMRQA